ncbi:MAG TPA: SemiSWEET transporter [Spongiibacteraceae bacterium]|nr:SemiSWEET transporter [Spongiibacteraceae bacterium]
MDMQSGVGCAAAVCTTMAFLPQAWMAIKTRNTQSLSLAMYIVFTVGVALWLAYGLLKNDWALIVSNGITEILSLTILIIKLRYDVFGGRRGFDRAQ